MAPVGGERSTAADGERLENRAAGSRGNAVVPQQQPSGPVTWAAVGRVVGAAWTALQFCHRYVLAPAAMWALRTLKAYIEEQVAIQRAMARPCPVPVYGEAVLRQATDDMGFTRRVLGTPYGMIVYAAHLGAVSVAVRQTPLHRLADVDAFWAEVAAGRSLLNAGRHEHVVSYLGCCPQLACHVYEYVRGTCSLREALLSSSPYSSALSSWEARMALCQQLVSAVVHLLGAGVSARELSASHVVLEVAPAWGADRPEGGASRSSANPAPRCWLAPGCGFRGEFSPAHTPATGRYAARSQPEAGPGARTRGRQQPGGPSWPTMVAVPSRAEVAASATVFPGESFLAMGRATGQVLLQILGGTDSPAPAPAEVLRALGDMAPSRLLSPGVAPPLTDEQAWPLLATIFSLLNWDQELKPLATDLQGTGTAVTRNTTDQEPAVRMLGRATGTLARRSPAASAQEWARALQSHLTQEVAPALTELQLQLQAVAAPTVMARPAAPQAPASAPSPVHNAFADASAPPLPTAFASPPSAPGLSPAPADRPLAAAGRSPSPVLRTAATPARGANTAAGELRSQGSTQQSVSAPDVSAAGPPEELLCPITTELMDDPVVAADGHSYERAAIARWFAERPGRPTSPLTGAALPHTGLTPNYALRKIIGDWKERHRD